MKRAVNQHHILSIMLNYYITINLNMSVISCITHEQCNSWSVIFPWQEALMTLKKIYFSHKI